MLSRRRWLFVGMGLLLFMAGCVMSPDRSTPPAMPTRAATTPIALGRGINLGNALEAPREGEWGV
ncbi:MAG: hypothetical protein N2439_02890, partial [Anaerolineae bacterium]|nr:hypothetical protein [Anaerolineae bacterium]